MADKTQPPPTILGAGAIPKAPSAQERTAMSVCAIRDGKSVPLTAGQLTDALLSKQTSNLVLCSEVKAKVGIAVGKQASSLPVSNLEASNDLPPRMVVEAPPRWETNVEVSSKLPPR